MNLARIKLGQNFGKTKARSRRALELPQFLISRGPWLEVSPARLSRRYGGCSILPQIQPDLLQKVTGFRKSLGFQALSYLDFGFYKPGLFQEVFYPLIET